MKNHKKVRGKNKFIALGVVVFTALIALVYQQFASPKSANRLTNYYLPVIDTYLTQAKQEKIKEFEAADRQYRIDLIETLFKRYNSPMQGLGGLIYDRAIECGGDYKIIVGIAGNESGFGRVPYKLYNPFGYLDGVQYASFQDAVYNITCAISKRFIVPCNGDLNCIVRTYAGPSDPKQQWVSNISWFMKQL